MVKIRFSYTLIVCFLSGVLSAQTIQLSGVVLNQQTKTPVSLVNIYTKDRQSGTASTTEGKFSLKISASQIDKYLYFSCIGYETDSLLISQTNLSPTIYLIPKIYELKEIYVIPDSTLLTLLRRAYSKIPENYPQQPTRYEGFYQESSSNDEGMLIKLVEAELAIYKESYNRKREAPGQVEILKSRLKQLQSSNVGTAGGALLPVSMDLVLQRSDYIQPQNLKYYHYDFNGVKSWKGNDCYEIEFQPLNNDSILHGIMLIDVKSLAYISFEISTETPKNTKSFSEMMMPVEANYKVEYEPTDGVWHLKYITARVRHERFNKNRLTSADYVTTQIQTDDAEPVPIDKRLGIMEPIEAIAEAYNPKGWTDSDLLAEEKTEQLGFQFSTDEAQSIFSQKAKTSTTFTDVLIKTLPKLIVGEGMQYNRKYETLVKQSIYGYRLNKKWSIQGQDAEDFYYNNITFKEISLGVEYRKNLNNAGYPLFLNTSLWLSHSDFKEKNHGRIREQAIVPQLSLSKQIGNLVTIEFFTNYPLVIHSNVNPQKKEYMKGGINLLCSF